MVRHNRWSAWFKQTGNVGQRRQQSDRTRLRAEALEDRRLLSGITSGPDGNLWLGSSGAIRRYSLADGQFTDFNLSSPTSNALAITAGPDGNLWFTEADRSIAHFFDGKIGRITPDGTLTEFDIPTPHAMYPGSPGGITVGPDGNIWFTEPLGNAIGEITLDGAITEFRLPTSGADPDSITAGPDGNLWFTEANHFGNGNRIGSMTPDGTVTEFSLPAPLSLGFTEEIAAGPDGNLWFPEAMLNQIARITPDGSISEFALPTPGFDPQRSTVGIAAGPDGNVWFTEFASNQIAQITPDGQITEFPLPDGTFPGDIAAGPDGNLWFIEDGGPALGEIVINGEPRPIAQGQSPAAVDGPVGEKGPELLKPLDGFDRPISATGVDALVRTIANSTALPQALAVGDTHSLSHRPNEVKSDVTASLAPADPLAAGILLSARAV